MKKILVEEKERLRPARVSIDYRKLRRVKSNC